MMANGTGWMKAMAAMKAATTQESIACPLCGQEMVWEGVAYFCRSGPSRMTTTGPVGRPCVDGGERADVYGAFDGYREDWQRQRLAIAMAGDVAVAELRTVRGYGGSTNLKAEPASGRPGPLPDGAEWVFAPWVPE